jgi:hypothetical protein
MQRVERPHELREDGGYPDDGGQAQRSGMQPRSPRWRDGSVQERVAEPEDHESDQNDARGLQNPGQGLDFFPHGDDLRMLGVRVE